MEQAGKVTVSVRIANLNDMKSEIDLSSFKSKVCILITPCILFYVLDITSWEEKNLNQE